MESLGVMDLAAVPREFPQFGRSIRNVARLAREVFTFQETVKEKENMAYEDASLLDVGAHLYRTADAAMTRADEAGGLCGDGCACGGVCQDQDGQPGPCCDAWPGFPGADSPDPWIDYWDACQGEGGGGLCTIEVVCEALTDTENMPPWRAADVKPQWHVWHCEVETVDCSGKRWAYGLMARGVPLGESGPESLPPEHRKPPGVMKSPVTAPRNAKGEVVGRKYQSLGKHSMPCLNTCLMGLDPCNLDWLGASYPHRYDFDLTGPNLLRSDDEEKNCVTFASWVANTLGLEFAFQEYHRGCSSEFAQGGW